MSTSSLLRLRPPAHSPSRGLATRTPAGNLWLPARALLSFAAPPLAPKGTLMSTNDAEVMHATAEQIEAMVTARVEALCAVLIPEVVRHVEELVPSIVARVLMGELPAKLGDGTMAAVKVTRVSPANLAPAGTIEPTLATWPVKPLTSDPPWLSTVQGLAQLEGRHFEAISTVKQSGCYLTPEMVSAEAAANIAVVLESRDLAGDHFPAFAWVELIKRVQAARLRAAAEEQARRNAEKTAEAARLEAHLEAERQARANERAARR